MRAFWMVVVPDWNDEVNGRRALANLVPDAGRYKWNAESKAFIWANRRADNETI